MTDESFKQDNNFEIIDIREINDTTVIDTKNPKNIETKSTDDISPNMEKIDITIDKVDTYNIEKFDACVVNGNKFSELKDELKTSENSLDDIPTGSNHPMSNTDIKIPMITNSFIESPKKSNIKSRVNKSRKTFYISVFLVTWLTVLLIFSNLDMCNMNKCSIIFVPMISLMYLIIIFSLYFSYIFNTKKEFNRCSKVIFWIFGYFFGKEVFDTEDEGDNRNRKRVRWN